MTTPADPKAAERAAAAPTPEQHDAARAFIGAHEASTMSDAIGALAALMATRERDAAVGALREAERDARNMADASQILTAKQDERRALLRLAEWYKARRLALEQGTPATREETP